MLQLTKEGYVGALTNLVLADLTIDKAPRTLQCAYYEMIYLKTAYTLERGLGRMPLQLRSREAPLNLNLSTLKIRLEKNNSDFLIIGEKSWQIDTRQSGQ